jgi:glutamate racemase
MDNRPIGVLDSGIGGLTVASAIAAMLPDEQLIYFGDTAHMPYGDKSKELIREYTRSITDFLINEKGCKCIVIACNTASAAAYEHLRDAYKGVIPIFNVIDPIIEAVVADSSLKKVGLIATKTTVESGVYQEKLSRRKPGLEYTALATPLLAPMIEEGFCNDSISHAVVHNYLEHEELRGIDSLILGCTHYVIIKSEINRFYNGKVRLFDSTNIVASKLKDILSIEGLLNGSGNRGEHHFYVSDFTGSFQKSTELFFGEKIKLELKKLKV